MNFYKKYCNLNNSEAWRHLNESDALQDIGKTFYIKGTGKVVAVLNWAPRHEDVLGEWRYSSTHFWPRH
jgi:hypothetical protein